MKLIFLLASVMAYEVALPNSFFKRHDPKTITLQTIEDKLVRANDDKKAIDTIDAVNYFYEEFRVEQKGHSFSFKTFHDTYLGLNKNLDLIQKNRKDFTSWFRVEKIDDSKIRLVAFNGNYLDRISNTLIRANSLSNTSTTNIFSSIYP